MSVTGREMHLGEDGEKKEGKAGKEENRFKAEWEKGRTWEIIISPDIHLM